MCFYHFHYFLSYSINFLEQNINQSGIGIGDKKLLRELNVFCCCCSGRFSFIQINHLNCVEICMFLSKSQKFYLPSGRSVTQFLFWNLEVREKFGFILPKRKEADLHSQSSLKVSIHETSRGTIDKTE